MVANQSSVIQQNVFRAKVTEPPSTDTICQSVCLTPWSNKRSLAAKNAKIGAFFHKRCESWQRQRHLWKKEKKVFSGKIFLLKERENKVLERFILDQNLLEELKKNYQIIQSFVSLASTISPTRLQVPIWGNLSYWLPMYYTVTKLATRTCTE